MRLTGQIMMRYFKRYIEREMYGPSYRLKHRPLQGWKEYKKKKFNWDEYRPWTHEFKAANTGKPIKKILVEPLKQQNIFKGDRVEILVGPDKGKMGIVNSIIHERNWVFVEGLNCEYKTESRTHMDPICQKVEKPLMINTQVKLVDPGDEMGTDIEWRYNEEGERVRVSMRSGRIIPLAKEAAMLDDFVNPHNYVPGEKDCNEKMIKDVTYKPSLKSFTEEINEEMGIKDDRKRAKTYWY